MSFSKDLKKRLIDRNVLDIKKRENMLSKKYDESVKHEMINLLHLDLIGMFFSANFAYIKEDGSFIYVTQNSDVSLYFLDLLSMLGFKVKYEKKVNRYYINIDKKDYSEYVAYLTDLVYSEEFTYDSIKYVKRIYTSMFLASGNIADPTFKYFFDINVLDLKHFASEVNLESAYEFESTLEYLSELVDSVKEDNPEINLSFKTHKLNETDVRLYLKKAEDIIRVLNLMEATKEVLDMENARIVKQIKNDINRVVNFEVANMNKSLDAITKQMNASRYIKDNMLEKRLTKKQLELVNIRLKNPEMEMAELSELIGVSKSSISNRFKGIYDIIAEDIEKDGDK